MHDEKDLKDRLIQLEERLEALERWKEELGQDVAPPVARASLSREEASISPAVEAVEAEADDGTVSCILLTTKTETACAT